MAMVSANEAVASLSRNAIQAGPSATAGSEVRFRYAVEAVEVERLGPDHALAFAPCTVTMVTAGRELQRQVAISLVLERSGGGWKLLHEHRSMRPQAPQGG